MEIRTEGEMSTKTPKMHYTNKKEITEVQIVCKAFFVSVCILQNLYKQQLSGCTYE